MKKILITGLNSYIGNQFEQYVTAQYPREFEIVKTSLRGERWKKQTWEVYDVVLHVAGLAHVDIKGADEEVKQNYYRINRDLTAAAAQKAKAEGVKQFIFLSSMIVYGESAPIGGSGKITANQEPAPANFYGDSKLQAEKEIQKLEEEDYKIVIVRLPMVFGKGAGGNYARLSLLARKSFLFPNIQNKRSMIYIENMCELLRMFILQEKQGIFCPQNPEIIAVPELVGEIRKTTGHKMWTISIFNPLIRLIAKKYTVLNKVFGDFYYEIEMSLYEDMPYHRYDMKEAVRRIEQ